MTRTDRKYHAAAILFCVGAGLYALILALDITRFSSAMAVMAVLWALLGVGLLRTKRWVGYIAFLAGLTGTVMAVGDAVSSLGVISTLYWAVLAINVLGAAILFGLLWKRPSNA